MYFKDPAHLQLEKDADLAGFTPMSHICDCYVDLETSIPDVFH